VEFELVIFRERVGHGLKDISCSAALTKCMSVKSTTDFFYNNEVQ